MFWYKESAHPHVGGLECREAVWCDENGPARAKTGNGVVSVNDKVPGSPLSADILVMPTHSPCSYPTLAYRFVSDG